MRFILHATVILVAAATAFAGDPDPCDACWDIIRLEAETMPAIDCPLTNEVLDCYETYTDAMAIHGGVWGAACGTCLALYPDPHQRVDLAKCLLTAKADSIQGLRDNNPAIELHTCLIAAGCVPIGPAIVSSAPGEPPLPPAGAHFCPEHTPGGQWPVDPAATAAAAPGDPVWDFWWIDLDGSGAIDIFDLLEATDAYQQGTWFVHYPVADIERPHAGLVGNAYQADNTDFLDFLAIWFTAG